ncbi:MAG: regulatory protein RecX [Ruminococcus sp.]|nr:regulatory protein RecX [Candidatus Apopatosoma intestinale]
MTYCIQNIRPSHDGEKVELQVEARDGNHRERRDLCLASEFFLGLSLPTSLSAPMETEQETVERLDYLSALTDAIGKGLNLLSFSDNTEKGLKNKLIQRGCHRDAAEEAAAYLRRKGFIREESQAEMLVLSLAMKKWYGEARIRQELFTKGFDPAVIARALEETEADYPLACAKRIESMGGLSLFAEQKSRIKTMASLSRYGFSYDVIRDAIRILKEQK